MKINPMKTKLFFTFLATLFCVPAMATQVAWRGERVNFTFPQMKVGEKFKVEMDGGLPVQVNFAHKVKAEGGERYDVLMPERVPGAETQFVVATVDVPADARVGVYNLRVDGKIVDALKVSSQRLPEPKDWQFYLDLWQHPEAVARWCKVPLWSDEHFEAMRPVMTRLANAGQKVITASIIEEPWDHQTFDDWHSMIRWTRKDNGKWTFDYSAFDKWVAFMESCGIDKQINCYTMLPWSKNLGYYDEHGNAKNMKLEPGTPLFEEVWSVFLKDFVKHLRATGKLKKTSIALDERPDAMARAARDILAKAAPELKIASAVDRPSREQDFAHDISPLFSYTEDIAEFAEKRRAAGKITTFYVCCGPEKPNTFPHSPLEESRWLPIYASAKNLDGFLRWAYNSWTENPFVNTKHRARGWAAGDCFLVYPPNYTTLRFEALRDGIEDYEKIRILRKRLSPQKMQAIDDALKTHFTVPNGHSGNCKPGLTAVLAEIDKLSK